MKGLVSYRVCPLTDNLLLLGVTFNESGIYLYNIEEDTMILEFNNYIFNDYEEKNTAS